MKVERNFLELTTLKIITEKNKDLKIRQNLTQSMLKYGISPAKVAGILNGTILLRVLNLFELCLLVQILYNLTKNESINPSLFFEEEELKRTKNYKANREDDSDNIIILEGVKKTGDNRYVCSDISWKKVTQYISKGLITYNIRTQRGAKLKKIENTLIEVAKLDNKKIEAISTAMTEGKFTPNMISLNIIRNGEEIFEYNAKKEELMIQVDNIKTFVNLVDGASRTCGALLALDTKPDLDLGTSINILNYTEDEAMAFIEQESKATPIPRQIRASLNTNNENLLITRYLNTYGNSKINEMFNKVAIVNHEIKYAGKYTTFEIISKAIESNFKFGSAREIEKIKKYLVDFFNELIGLLKETKNYDKIENIVISPNIFIGYIAFASLVYKNEDWKHNVELIVKKITKSNCRDILENLPIGNLINKTTINQMTEYFQNLERVK